MLRRPRMKTRTWWFPLTLGLLIACGDGGPTGGTGGNTTGGAAGASSGTGGRNCEPGPTCTCGDTAAHHCICTCSTAEPWEYPADLPADNAEACAANDGAPCGNPVDGGSPGVLSCDYTTLPWCGI